MKDNTFVLIDDPGDLQICDNQVKSPPGSIIKPVPLKYNQH